MMQIDRVTAFVGARLRAIGAPDREQASSLSDLKNRSENLTGRGQILMILQGNSSSIAQEISEIWTVQADLQPISFKSDRLLAPTKGNAIAT